MAKDENGSKITYLPIDEYRYQSELRHLVKMAKTPGAYDLATKKSRELAERDEIIFGKLPGELWAELKAKP